MFPGYKQGYKAIVVFEVGGRKDKMLVTCPECGSKISGQANPCPKCGLPSAGKLSFESCEHRAKKFEKEGVYHAVTRKCANPKCNKNLSYSGPVKAEIKKSSKFDEIGYKVVLTCRCPLCGKRTRIKRPY
jgi:hypothetical protein